MMLIKVKQQRKKAIKRIEKKKIIIDFLESKTERSKILLTKNDKQTFITTQLLL